MIYLVRHGQTAFNHDGRLQGHLDSPLTPLGIEQATRVGALLKSLIDDPAAWSIAASPLGRAAHTARIVAEAAGLGAITLDDRLREIGMGAWDGLTWAEIAAAAPETVAGAPPHELFFHSPDGETYAVFAGRLGAWLAEARASGRDWVVVSHGVAGRVLRGLYAGLDWNEAVNLPAPQDAIFRLAGGVIERIECAPAALAPEEAGR
jgi:broad specificity phosphatase PhoE